MSPREWKAEELLAFMMKEGVPEWPLEAENSPQLTARKWKHHFYNTEEMNSANKLNEQGNDYPPQHPERNPAPLTP